MWSHLWVSLKSNFLQTLNFCYFFRESCIRRWIQESAAPKSCPQCKTKTCNRDIRFIYATKVRVEDNSREVAAKLELEELQLRYNELKKDNSLNSVQIAVQKAEIRQLREEIEFLKNSCRTTTDRATAGIRTIKTCRVYMEKNLDFKENLNSRLMKYMSRNKKLIVSQKSPTSALFPGHGLKLIDFSTYRAERFINASNSVVTDFSIDSSESFLVAASKEASCKMYHIPTSASNCVFTPPGNSPIWSCAFDHERPNNLYLGAQNGVTYIYDTRRSTEVLREIVNPQARSPVKFTIAIKPNSHFERGGFFTVHVRGVFFYEYLTTGEFASTTLNINEPVLTMSYDEKTEMVLITKGPNANFVQSRHVLMKLSKEDGIPVLNEIYSFNGTSSNFPDLSRPTQIKVPDGLIVLNYHQDTKMLQARSPSTDLLHELHIASDPITDLCPIYIDNTCWFAALSHSRCRMFKVIVGY